MKKYIVNGVELITGPYNIFIVNGEEHKLEGKPGDLFLYFLEHAGELKTKAELVNAVWGHGDQFTFKALANALSTLRKLLPEDVQITNKHGKGYVFAHDVKIEAYKLERVEQALVYSKSFKRGLWVSFLTAIIIVILLATIVVQNHNDAVNPPQKFALNNTNALNTRDYIVGLPQISPNGRFVAHRLSRKLTNESYLGLFDKTKGDTQPIAKMGYADGFSWDLSGRRIVYQDRTNGNCEIRLVTLDDEGAPINNELLSACLANSGHLNFAWFNDNEFYFNGVARSEIVSDNGLPLHHLYGFNIQTKRTTKLAEATYQGGIGFYSLKYDKTTDILHLLQSDHFVKTDFYQYHKSKLNKVHRVEYEVPYIGVSNNRMVYKNQHGHLVVNYPADDFYGQQLLTRPVAASLNYPHLMGNQLVFVAGDTADFVVHELNDKGKTLVHLNGFRPRVIGVQSIHDSNSKQLLFSSDQTGRYQLYQLKARNQAVQISDFKINENIQAVAAVDDKFVLSYLNRVEVHRLVNGKLTLIEAFKGFRYGVLNQSGTKLLLTQVSTGLSRELSNELSTKSAAISRVIEKQMNTTGNGFTDTGLIIDQAKLAFYYHGAVIYINQHNELMRLSGAHSTNSSSANSSGAHNRATELLTTDIDISAIYFSALAGDSFYYIAAQGDKKTLNYVDLALNTKRIVDIGKIKPTYIQAIGESVYIRAREALSTKLVLGELVQQ